MKRLRAADLRTGSLMASWNDPADEQCAGDRTAEAVRQLLHRASYARMRGQDAVADELRLEAQALADAFTQHQQALHDAREQISELAHAVHAFWEKVADDRTLHDLADDASVLLTLYDDLDRAQSRLITLEMTRP